jgi:DNA repair exonuclease SbcCD ATPase subunit
MDPAYIDLLDTNKELRKELADEISENKLKDKKLKALTQELENCYRTLSHQDSTIIVHEDEIASLKSEIKSLKQHLQKALRDLRHKSNASTAQDIHILRLEDKVDQLKKRIREITDKKLSQINSSPMALPGMLRDVATALDRIENYLGGDTTVNPINTLNGIRITLTTVREHMDRVANEALHYQGLLNTAYGRINYLMNDLVNTRNDLLRGDQMMTQAWRDERRARQAGDAKIIELRRSAHRYINEVGRWRRRHTACTQQAQNLKRHYQQYKDETDWEAFWTLNKYQKWKARELNSK